jgi:hypothetical protein
MQGVFKMGKAINEEIMKYPEKEQKALLKKEIGRKNTRRRYFASWESIENLMDSAIRFNYLTTIGYNIVGKYQGI